MLTQKPRVYADFHNADSQGRLRLDCTGTLEDLSQQQIVLREGLLLTLYADDSDAQGRLDELLAEGVVAYSPEEHCWVAAIDWNAVRHTSNDRHEKAGIADPNGIPTTPAGRPREKT